MEKKIGIDISGNFLTKVLMLCSVGLLVLLQFFWLRGSYEKAFGDLRKDTNFLLRNTISEMRDSILLKNLKPVDSDSAKNVSAFLRNDSLPASIARIESSVHTSNFGETGSSVRILITTPDSVHSDVIRPLANRIAQIKGSEGGQKSFVIRLNDDTLNTDSVSSKFARALSKNEITIPFRIRVMKDFPEGEESFLPFGPHRKKMMVKRFAMKEPDVFSDSLQSDLIGLNPLFKYTATFAGVRTFILKQIAPEILFAVFLTLMTSGAFALVYKNMREQQRLIAAKDDFISNVTHELKTPVATVSVALEALRNFSAIDNPKLTREYLDIAQRELSRLSGITDRILKTSVLEQPQLKIMLNQVDLFALCESVTGSMRLLADNVGAVLEFQAHGRSFIVLGSEEHLSNALYNLLDNAIKYRSENCKIDVKLTERSDMVTIAVKDNGPGIDPTYHDKIFEKFFRVPSGNVHDIKGYGLGLNYVHTVVGLHRGQIELKSNTGEGSEFILSFSKVDAHAG